MIAGTGAPSPVRAEAQSARPAVLGTWRAKAFNKRALPAIEKLFGSRFLDPAGGMDRKKMRDHVFANPAAKRALEGLLHPMIREESARRIAAASAPYVVHVVPLLIESPDYRRRVPATRPPAPAGWPR